MTPIKIENLASILKGHCHRIPTNTTCTGLSIDSRDIQPGDIYVAIRGERLDGHAFIPQAIQAGASCCLVDHRLDFDVPQLIVPDTINALAQWARWSRENNPAKVIGITGSVGKTTTRQMIYHVLQEHYRCWQSPKNFNNHIGLPLTLLTAPADIEIIVAELGTNHPGEIAQLTAIAQPDIAVVTYAAPAHLEGLGSLEAVVTEKLSIRKGLRKDGTFFVNTDCRPLWSKANHVTGYGLSPDADICGKDVICSPEGIGFTIENQNVTVPIHGPGHIQNALACWAVCRCLGLSPEQISQALAQLPPLSMRSECLTIGSLTVLNDCYNANPASMVNALKTLDQLDPEQQRRRIFVCGDMGELGPQEEQLHRDLGQTIADVNIDHVITVGPLATIAAEAAQTLRPETQISRYKDVDDAKASLQCLIQDNDLILIKGSRSAHLEHIATTLQEINSHSLITNNE